MHSARPDIVFGMACSGWGTATPGIYYLVYSRIFGIAFFLFELRLYFGGRIFRSGLSVHFRVVIERISVLKGCALASSILRWTARCQLFFRGEDICLLARVNTDLKVMSVASFKNSGVRHIVLTLSPLHRDCSR